MSGIGLSLRSGRGVVAFTPHSVSAVSRWLRCNQTASGVATISDQKGGANATQPTAANQPTATTLGGQPAISFDGLDDFLIEPFSAANNGTARRGFMFRFKPATVTGAHSLMISTAAAGSSVRSIELSQFNADLFVNVAASAFVARRFTVANAFTLNVEHTYSWEEDLGQSAEADKCTIWIDGVKQTGTFTNDAGTPNAQPAAMVAPTGSMAIGVSNVTGFNAPLSGVLRRNILWLAGAGGISGGGLLSPAERTDLGTFLAND